LKRKFSRAFFFELYHSHSVKCSSNISDLGGTHVQQSFSSRRNTYAAVFYVPFPRILCAAFSCTFKSDLYFLTLLSTPRGPPARKSSHFLTRFAFPCTVVVVVVVVVVRLFRFQRSLRITFRECIFFFTGTAFGYKLTDSTGYIYGPACR